MCHARPIRRLQVEQFPVSQAASQELRPLRHGQFRSDLFR
jgi:hypothetical protein